MVISIPIIATAIIKGGEVAFAAVTGASSIQSAAIAEGTCAGIAGSAADDDFLVGASFILALS